MHPENSFGIPAFEYKKQNFCSQAVLRHRTTRERAESIPVLYTPREHAAAALATLPNAGDASNWYGGSIGILPPCPSLAPALVVTDDHDGPHR